jgi:signal transduction histidine kinase
LQRLLVNLLDNAIKHSPPRSTVIAGIVYEPDRVTLFVEDNGPGIPLAEQERIFERFYRIGSELRRETPGIGLGLAIVQHIAEVHGGTVRVRSAPGQGSRFIVKLPWTPANRVSQPPTISRPDSPLPPPATTLREGAAT